MALFIASPLLFRQPQLYEGRAVDQGDSLSLQPLQKRYAVVIERRNASAIDLNLLTFCQNWIAQQL